MHSNETPRKQLGAAIPYMPDPTNPFSRAHLFTRNNDEDMDSDTQATEERGIDDWNSDDSESEDLETENEPLPVEESKVQPVKSNEPAPIPKTNTYLDTDNVFYRFRFGAKDLKFRSRVEFTNKEKAFIEIIYGHYYITSDNLLYIFSHKGTAYNYIKKLTELDFLDSRRMKGFSIWAVSKKGIAFIEQTEGVELDHFDIARVHLGEIDHHTIVSNINIILKQHSDISNYKFPKFVDQHYHVNKGYYQDLSKRKDKKFRIPDAEFVYKDLQQSYRTALEVELTPKDKKRYKQIYEFYERNTEIDRVMWFCNARYNVYKTLSSIFQSFYKEGHSNKHVFVTDIDQFFECGSEANTVDLKGRRIDWEDWKKSERSYGKS